MMLQLLQYQRDFLLLLSYAYFGFFVGEGANAIINVSTEQPDDLHFDVDKELSMTLNQFNFTAEAGNLFDTATALYLPKLVFFLFQ